MKKLLLLVLGIALLASCNINVKNDDGPQVTSVRHTRPFDKIEMNSACDVRFVQGDSFSVKVVGGKNAVKEVTTEFEGTTLKIGTQQAIRQFNFGIHRTMPTIYVTSPDLIACASTEPETLRSTNHSTPTRYGCFQGRGQYRTIEGRLRPTVRHTPGYRQCRD
jgi:hypothetical protein